MTKSALITVMVRAAEKAARGLKRDFGELENLQVSRKGPGDFVSAADYRSQEILREELSKARPDFGFLMEEDDGKERDDNSKPRWIVDPLDGTTNFLHAVPHWCISIALEQQGEIVAGLVYAPIFDEMFWAEKGSGAFSNRSRLRVSARRDMSECLLATGIPFRGHEKPGFLNQLVKIIPHVSGVRRFGAAALDLAYVAAGRFDGYWETGVSCWDVAAGTLLVTEAGGKVSPFVKGDHPVHGAGLISSNYEMHESLVTLLRSA